MPRTQRNVTERQADREQGAEFIKAMQARGKARVGRKLYTSATLKVWQDRTQWMLTVFEITGRHSDVQ